jgi:hypothetical protein
MHEYMGNVLLQPGAQSVLEWVLFVALALSGLCMVSLGTMMIIGKWRMYQKRRTLDAFRRPYRHVSE